MSSFANQKQIEFLDLYRNTVNDVFRFFLARCGDWQEAQQITRFVFLQAAKIWNNEKPLKIPPTEWLFQLAITLQYHHPFFETLPENDFTYPSQQQMTFFARIQELSEQWKSLPSKQADGLALILFTALELGQIASILGWTPFETQSNLSKLISTYSSLRALRDSLIPVGYFIQRLEKEIQAILELSVSSGILINLKIAVWRWEYLHEKILGFLSKTVPAMLFLGILFLAILKLSGPSKAFPPFNPESPSTFMDEPTASVKPTKALPRISSFQSVEDQMVYVGWDGAIRMFNLKTHGETTLTEPGFYQPSERVPLTSPSISPDGNWLLILRPNDQTLWLVATNGSKTAMKISSSMVPYSWSPDSKFLFLGKIEDFRTINLLSIEKGDSIPFIRLPGEVLSVSVSPNNQWIAVMYKPQSKAQSNEVYLGLLDRSGKKRIVLTSKKAYTLPSPPFTIDFRLLWTEQSDQLWIPNWGIAYSIDDTILAELEPSESDIPVGQNVSMQEMPLWTPPTLQEEQEFAKWLALYGNDVYLNLQYLRKGSRVFLSPDHQKVLISQETQNETMQGYLTLKETRQWDSNLWTNDFPVIQKAFWTADQKFILMGESLDKPGRIFLLPVENPQQFEILSNDGFLLGTFSHLQSQSKNLAPAFPVETIHAATPVRIPAPGVPLGSFLVPFGWQIWIYNSPTPTLSISNFFPADPIGWTALDSSKVWINIRQGKFLSSSLVQSPPADFQTISGFPVYHFSTTNKADQSLSHDVYWIYLKEQEAALSIDYQPLNTQQKAWVEKIILSFEIENRPEQQP